MENRFKEIFKKDFVVKEGQEDWRVWNRASDYLCILMEGKREHRYVERMLKKSLKVQIIVSERS